MLLQDGWIEDMSARIALDLSFNNSYKAFEVRTTGTDIMLYPNTPNNLRLNLSYEFISFGIQFSPDFLPGNGDEKLRGRTDSWQIGTAIILRHWFSELSYSRVKGYYVKNSADFNIWSPGDPFIQFPELHHWGISISSGYIHNPRFSFRSLTSHTERQLKSAGSFIPVLNIDLYEVDDKSSAPTTDVSNNIELILGPGYAYTFVHKQRYYVSAGLFGQLGYLNTKVTRRTPTGSYNTSQDNLVFRWDFRGGLGFNGDRFYGGFYSRISGVRYRQENTTVMNTELRFHYHLFLGFRLFAPRQLSKGMRKLKQKI